MARLGDICNIQSGGTPSRSNQLYWENGSIPWVKISDIKNKYLNETEEHITDEGLNNSSAKVFPAGTLLYTIFATLGEVCILNIDAATNQAITGLQIIDDDVDTNYLYYYLMSLKSKVNNMGRGVAQNNINMQILKNFEIPLPPLEEQQKIAAVLDKVSDLIEKRRQQLEKLDLLVKAKFVEMFDLNVYNYVTLGDSTDFIDYRGHTPTLSNNGNIRMVNAKSVGKGFFKYVDEYVTEETYNSWMHRGFGHPGDVLFVTEGHTFGNTCQVPEGLTKFALGQRVITIQGHKGMINNTFLCAYMQTDKFIKDINIYKTGGTAQGIRSKDLEKVKIPLYPYKQQEFFDKFVSHIEKTKSNIIYGLEKLETLKKALMQEYFG